LLGLVPLFTAALVVGAVRLMIGLAMRGHPDGQTALAATILGRRFELGHPRALYLLALVPMVFFALRASLVDLPRAQQRGSAVVRALLLIVLALALSRPSTIGERATVATVLLVDVSDSVGDRQLEAARHLVEQVRGAQQGDDLLFLVTFAKTPHLVDLPPKGQPLPATSWRGTDGDGSDLSGALSFAYGLYPAGTIRRAVLVSDGNETTGNLAAEAQTARDRGIRIDHMIFDAERTDEVLIRELRLPSDAKIGQRFEVTAEVYSTKATPAVVTLFRDEFVNPLDGRKEVQLEPGRNLIKWRSELTQAGVTNFRAVISGGNGGKLPDHFAANNSASTSVEIRGKPRVLYVEGELPSARYLQTALQKENIDVEVRGPYGLPTSAKELGRFDLVIVSDVPSMFVGAGQMAAIEQYVKDGGGGFIMAGGESSFGSGGWSGTRMETFVPVRFDSEKKRDQPSLGLVLCIDKSGSMTGEKIELAKEAARATAGVLSPDDLLGVIGFDSMPTAVVRLQRAANRTAIQRQISSIAASGGTNILLPLKMAYDELAAAQAKVKHVILLTDGIAPTDGIAELVDDMAAHKITVSAVGVGGEADKTILTTIAERGGGRFYHTMDPQNVPRIFTKETTEVAKTSLVEEPIGVRVVRGAELLAGVGIDTAPPLRGYVSTKPKPLSEVILESTRGEPILARWRQGLGQVVVFTSDVKNRWAVDWLRWQGYSKFWAQLIRSTMRHQPGGGGGLAGASFDLKVELDPPHARVTLDAIAADDKFLSGLDASLQIVDPQKPGARVADRTRALRQTAPGHYETTVDLDRYGAYVLRGTLKRDGAVVGEATSTLSLPYPREYLALPPDEALLQRVSSLTGGRAKPTPGQIFDPGQARVRFERELWPWLLWLAAALLLLDVASRRLRLVTSS